MILHSHIKMIYLLLLFGIKSANARFERSQIETLNFWQNKNFKKEQKILVCLGIIWLQRPRSFMAELERIFPFLFLNMKTRCISVSNWNCEETSLRQLRVTLKKVRFIYILICPVIFTRIGLSVQYWKIFRCPFTEEKRNDWHQNIFRH